MHTYLTLNYPTAGRSQLIHYLRRAGWLNLSQSGAFTDEMLGRVQSSDCGLIFLRLASPDEAVPGPFLDALRRHPALIVTSPYPPKLFAEFGLQPLDFLTEPYSFERFAASLEKYTSRFG